MLLVRTTLDISRIHGIGLFAAEFIREGTILWRLHPNIDILLTEEQINELAAPSQEQTRRYTYRDRYSGLYVLCGDDARFFNHSDDPNCLDIVNSAEEELTIARRDIEPGEELTCDYASFDLDLLEGKYKL
jgi:SET domain-containing protein